AGIFSFQEEHGRNWREPFIDFYLGPRMEVALGEACGLPSFSSDVARADDETRAVYEAGLEQLVEVIADGLCGTRARESAQALLAIGRGGYGEGCEGRAHQAKHSRRRQSGGKGDLANC